jgi:FdhD protein
MDKIEVLQINRGRAEKKEVLITEEVPLTIEVNGEELATLLCSPTDLKEMVIGFLFNTGVIPKLDRIDKITIDSERWKTSVELASRGPSPKILFKRIYTSGCGKGIIFHNPIDLTQRARVSSGLRIESGRITEMMKVFLSSSREHKVTRGVHSGALASKDGILIFRDDLGRHNAIDKVIGSALMQDLNFDDKLILTSGRISSEIISKVLRCQVPVVVSSGAPTDQAVKLARDVDLTLVGFARGRNMQIFSGEQRVAQDTMEETKTAERGEGRG